MSVEQGALLEAAKQGDNTACQQILMDNNRLIWAIVKRYTGRGTDPEDLFQLGCIGFLKAIQGYDPNFGTRFSTYAVPKIAGEMRRFLRDDGAVKVSRTLKEQGIRICMLREQLIQQTGQEPTIGELAQRTGLDCEEIAMAEGAMASVASLQTETGEGLTLESMLGEESMEEKTLDALSLRQAIARLPERERNVIQLRYFHSLTQQKIADLVGVSQVQVSRIEKRAVQALREQLL